MTTNPQPATVPVRDAAESAAVALLNDPSVSDARKARLRGLLLATLNSRLSALHDSLQHLKGSSNV